MIQAFKAEMFRIRRHLSYVVFVGLIAGICAGFSMLHIVAREATMGIPDMSVAAYNRMGSELLPNTFAFFSYYYDIGFIHLLLALPVVLFESSVFGKTYETGMLRTLIGHGVSRRRYLFFHLVADFAVLLIVWSLGAVLIAGLGLAFDYLFLGNLAWSPSCWGAMLRMILGHSSQQMAIIGFTLLGVILSRQAMYGFIGGIVYVFISMTVSSAVASSWLTSQPFLSFLFTAHKTVIDPGLPWLDPGYMGAFVVLWIGVAGIMAVNLWLFGRQEIA
ncbi:MAG: hypothetical protein JXA21_22675 [Anaerolineae bacterium]|nr:hypothetical protein [Anaerolineae bacterium]